MREFIAAFKPRHRFELNRQAKNERVSAAINLIKFFLLISAAESIHSLSRQ